MPSRPANVIHDGAGQVKLTGCGLLAASPLAAAEA
jgi:hypothetical protein